MSLSAKVSIINKYGTAVKENAVARIILPYFSHVPSQPVNLVIIFIDLDQVWRYFFLPFDQRKSEVDLPRLSVIALAASRANTAQQANSAVSRAVIIGCLNKNVSLYHVKVLHVPKNTYMYLCSFSGM